MDSRARIEIEDIWTIFGPANQHIVSIQEPEPLWRELNTQYIYSSSARVRKIAAFRLIRSQNSSRFEIPLQVAAVLSVQSRGYYRLEVETDGGDFKLESDAFLLNQGQNRTTVGPFFLNLAVDWHFKVNTERWHLSKRQDPSWTECTTREHPSIEMYIFLGPTALRLNNAGDRDDVHILELLRRTIPAFHTINGESWATVEQMLLEHVVLKLWMMSSTDFRYNSVAGQTSFLFGAFFQLGDMLAKQGTRVNCFDLAALVYAALKSFGTRFNPANNTYTNVFDVNVYRVQNWGKVRSGALFGHHSTFESPTNNPFHSNPDHRKLFDRDHQLNSLPRDDPRRWGFSQHCFTLFRTTDSPERVFDICQIPQEEAKPLIDPDSGGILLPPNWPQDLQTYLDESRDEGEPQRTSADLIAVPITWVNVNFFPGVRIAEDSLLAD